MKKVSRSYFGYKLHVEADLDYWLIRAFKATTASVHDSQVALSNRSSTGGGYSGVPAKGYSTTMQRGTRAGPISLFERLRKVWISRRRAPIERVFAVLKRSFRAALHDHDRSEDEGEDDVLLPLLQPHAGAYP